MKADVLPMHINFSMCSYETKIVITRSADSINGPTFCNMKVKWTQYSAQKLFLSHCFNFFVGIYHIPCSDEFVNHS